MLDRYFQGNVLIKNSSGSVSGGKLNFGDGDFVHLYEIVDDSLEIKANTTWITGKVSIGNGSGFTTKPSYQLYVNGSVFAKTVHNAVWNDYAECREANTEEPGRVLFEKGDDTLRPTTERLQAFAGVSSDTYGIIQGETDKAKTPVAVAGRVLVYTYQNRNNYKPGDCVCAAPGGTVDIMTREEIIEYPDRIVGTVSCVPTYEEWGTGKVKINGRIWIKVK